MPELAPTAKPCSLFWPISAIADERQALVVAREHLGAVGGRELHLAREQELQVLAGLRVADVDVERLLLEVALLLRDVGADEGQVGLGLEAGHERDVLDLLAGHGRRRVAGACRRRPRGQRHAARRQRSDATCMLRPERLARFEVPGNVAEQHDYLPSMQMDSSCSATGVFCEVL